MLNSVAQIDPIFNDSLETKPRRKGGRPKKQAHAPFVGFTQESIQGEYFQVPAIFLSLCAMIDNLAELKVVMYVMRHTWGFREYGTPKRITIDEFMHGRMRVDGTRMDLGTGLSESAIKDGLQRAIDHEIIVCYVDDSDQARIKNYYELKMQNEEAVSPEPEYFEEQTTTETSTDQLEPDYPTQEEYDPYADTIFAQSPKSPNQKFFVSEPELITGSEGVINSPGGSKQLPRSENRTLESTLRTNDIRITHSSENLEDFIRSYPDQLPKAKAKSPAFIRNMITDFSRDLGDQDHIFSNISQAAKIYRDSGMSEEAFMQVLYDARVTAKKATQIKHLNSHGRPNRMPYFFRCLSGALSRETAV
jgi:hypothetical protein